MAAGLTLGRLVPGTKAAFQALQIDTVSLPIALGLLWMMYPVLAKVKYEELPKAFKRYCPGCTHGIAHRLIAEVIDELDVRDRTVTIATVGCSVFADEYFNTDAVQAAHGRAPAVATGIKRTSPDTMFSPTRAMVTWPPSGWPR